ncbi:hypothetical protein KFL_003200070 [Klebsormidium nitens]|uniref:MYND-type domain-containing protein n=1 Tax=Klebsormidium nitens TaxID=105231 RepID=A0A1Y1I7H5_KLENI|nr:hypothetical protein KFL_003200070 [Klebsormidium nitens]|eukprot:GAQ86915.1 hypothetical protein KFL_003200070 [Klebsormidium nitens]
MAAAAVERQMATLSLEDIAAGDVDWALAWVDSILAGERGHCGYAPLPTRKGRLKELSVCPEFATRVSNAGPREAQGYVGRGLFKQLCMNMNEYSSNNAPVHVRIILSLSNLIRLIHTLPNLQGAKLAWDLGVVRPAAELFKAVAKRSQHKPWRELIYDNSLVVSVNFFSTMALPLSTLHLPLDAQADAATKQVATKFYRWFCKEGCMPGLLQILISVSKADLSTGREDQLRLVPLWSSAASVVCICARLDLHRDEMVTTPGVLDAVVRGTLLYESQGEGMATHIGRSYLCIIQQIWLYSSRIESNLSEAVCKRAILQLANHKDVEKLLLHLRGCLEHRNEDWRGACACFVELAHILTLTHPRTLPSTVYESCCDVMANAIDFHVYLTARTIISAAFHRRKLSPAQLLAHLFPGLVRAFKNEATQRSPIGDRTETELERLEDMLEFLFLAFRNSLVGMGTDPDSLLSQGDGAEGTELPPGDLPGLVKLMVDRKLPPVLVTLRGSPHHAFDTRLHHFLCVLASAGAGCATRVRQNLAETLAPPLLAALGTGKPVVASVRLDILKMILWGYRRDGRPPKYLGDRVEKGRSGVVYNWERNEWTSYGVGSRAARDAARLENWLREGGVGGGSFGVLWPDESPVRSGDPVGRNSEGEGRSILLVDPEEICAMCKKSTSAARRCSGCRGVFYCGVACQKQDWKRHRADCRKGTGEGS